MEPEAVIPRFIASVDLGGVAALSRHRRARPVEKTKQALGVTAGDLEKANLVEMRHAKSDNPLRFAQLNRDENLSALESALSALSSQSSHGALLVSRSNIKDARRPSAAPWNLASRRKASPFCGPGRVFFSGSAAARSGCRAARPLPCWVPAGRPQFAATRSKIPCPSA